MRRLPLALAAPALLGVALACGAKAAIRVGQLRIEPGYANVAPTGDGGTAYFVVRNPGALPDTLTSVAVAGASSAHIHTMTRTGGMERMTPLDPAVVPPKGALQLAPGAAHLMFEGLGRRIAIGDTVLVRLGFARNGSAEVRLVVRPYGG
ncbi:MAG: copper chaperone PCu(A)C [Deltaproteobacteria bacterium]